MKFVINKNVFVKSLENVIKAIDSTNIYIHLRNFYIEVLDEMIIIKGSNGYFSIESKIEIQDITNIESIGNFLVPASLFMNIIKKCSNNNIEIYSNNNVLFIKNEKDEYEINLANVEDFPFLDFSLYGNKIKINAEKLRKAIDNVIFATSTTSEEVILSGVNLKYEGNKLYITATDSFRLAREIIEIQDDRNINFDVTIANRNIKNFIPQNVEGDVILYANEHKINLLYETSNFQSKIIDAPYKMVSQLFEIKFDKSLLIDKNVLNNALMKASLISGDVAYNKMFFEISSDQIVIKSQAEEIGRIQVILEKNKFEYYGEPISIVLNNKYLKEAINVFNDKIKINLLNSRTPILIESEDSLNKQIISPMNF